MYIKVPLAGSYRPYSESCVSKRASRKRVGQNHLSCDRLYVVQVSYPSLYIYIYIYILVKLFQNKINICLPFIGWANNPFNNLRFKRSIETKTIT